MLQREHFAILSNFIKLPVAIKTFILSIFEWPFYTGFTVFSMMRVELKFCKIIHLSIYFIHKHVFWLSVKTDEMRHDVAFHRGLYCLQSSKQIFMVEMHHNLEITFCDPLKYKMGNSILILLNLR